MNIINVNCISEVIAEKVIATSTLPIKIMGSDFTIYLCKHAVKANTGMLFNEYISACFLKIWKLEFPDFGFITINKDQISDTVIHKFSSISYGNFAHPLFCVQYLNYAKESDDFIAGETKRKKISKKIQNFDDLARIALFDIWMSNEDRTLNNNNLLIHPGTKNSYKIIPIDHACVFNTNMARDKMFLINENDTIINSQLFSVFLQKHNKDYYVRLLKEITKEFRSHVTDCEKHKDQILQNVPSAWNIDIDQKSLLLDYLFSNDWTSKVINHFKQFFTLKIINK
jgi:hypothetical protein